MSIADTTPEVMQPLVAESDTALLRPQLHMALLQPLLAESDTALLRPQSP